MRVAGINIPDDKQVQIALTYVYGVGSTRAKKILKEAGIDFIKRAKDLDQAEVNKIKEIIDRDYKIEGELRQVIKQNIGMLKEMGAYRGTRHMRGLPARGQRTKTNNRTVRGNTRKTAGSGKRKVELK